MGVEIPPPRGFWCGTSHVPLVCVPCEPHGFVLEEHKGPRKFSGKYGPESKHTDITQNTTKVTCQNKSQKVGDISQKVRDNSTSINPDTHKRSGCSLEYLCTPLEGWSTSQVGQTLAVLVEAAAAEPPGLKSRPLGFRSQQQNRNPRLQLIRTAPTLLPHVQAWLSWSERGTVNMSSVRFRLKPENWNSHRLELDRPSIKGTKLLMKVIKAIIIFNQVTDFGWFCGILSRSGLHHPLSVANHPLIFNYQSRKLSPIPLNKMTLLKIWITRWKAPYRNLPSPHKFQITHWKRVYRIFKQFLPGKPPTYFQLSVKNIITNTAEQNNLLKI